MQLEKDGQKCTSIHGDLELSARDRVVNEFREGKTRVLIATDVLSRGFDVQQVRELTAQVKLYHSILWIDSTKGWAPQNSISSLQQSMTETLMSVQPMLCSRRVLVRKSFVPDHGC